MEEIKDAFALIRGNWLIERYVGGSLPVVTRKKKWKSFDFVFFLFILYFFHIFLNEIKLRQYVLFKVFFPSYYLVELAF